MNGPRFTHVAAAGWRAVAALETTGGLWVCGTLPGLGTFNVFTKTLDDVVTVACGPTNIVAVARSGSVLVAGRNDTAQHGDGSDGDTDLLPDGFRRVPGLDQVRSVAVGDGHVVAVDGEDNLWGWGANTRGQLNADDPVDLVWPTHLRSGVAAVAAAHHETLIVDIDGTLHLRGTPVAGAPPGGAAPGERCCGTVSGVSHVAANYAASLVIAGNGDLYGSGVNDHGQFGDGVDTHLEYMSLPFPTHAVTAAISDHSVVIDDTGSLWVSGANGDGQLGFGDDADRDTFTRVDGAPAAISVAAAPASTHLVADDGTLWFAGGENSGVGLSSSNTFIRIDVDSKRTSVAAELASSSMTVTDAYELADLALRG